MVAHRRDAVPAWELKRCPAPRTWTNPDGVQPSPNTALATLLASSKFGSDSA